MNIASRGERPELRSSAYLPSHPHSTSTTEYLNKPLKSPTINKPVSLYNKVANRKAMKYKRSKHDMKSKKHKPSHNTSKPEPKTSKANRSSKNLALKDRSYNAGDLRSHNLYSSMFSEGAGMNSQLNSMIFSKRPASNASMANSEYNMLTSVGTSQNSLRQAIMSTIKRKNSKGKKEVKYPSSEQMTPLDSKFTKSLQIHSPGSKFSHREPSLSRKSPQKKAFLRYRTTLTGHKNSVNCLAIDDKYYASLFSGSKDYSVKVWHFTSFSPRTIVDDETTPKRADT